ncbi:uncharacterized protein J3D65DRAFT_656121 [Phyllosticta citribraziliensis]|uniref:Calpain catalytic domain-containing protein n=1 Tax=Phyllosticta citribraziliensis TaxID=989973 RepID=A0ABR1M5H7_9PEZI
MANDARLVAVKAQLDHVRKRMAESPDKDQALQLAIEAAELCMSSLRLATDKTHKADLSSQAKGFISEAERIKKNSQWPSPSPSSSSLSRLPPSSPAASSNAPASPISSPLTGSKSPAPSAKAQRVLQLVSQRPLPTAEQIILYKASSVNGSQFPPWKDIPQPKEFSLDEGNGRFSDHTLFRFSEDQLNSLDGWMPAADALPPPAWYPGGKGLGGPAMQADKQIDLVQDAATDCSVVASLCSIVARPDNGKQQYLANLIWPFNKMTSTPEISANGKYIFRLNFNGCWRKVVIDDRLPVSKSTRMLHVVDRNNPSLLWPALLEKAYLKVRGGYDFPGSSSCTDLWTILGWIPEQIHLQGVEVVPDELWTRLSKAFGYGDVLMTVGTGNMSRRTEKELGLESQHDYAVVDLRTYRTERQFLLKNPWTEGNEPQRGKRTPSASELLMQEFVDEPKETYNKVMTFPFSRAPKGSAQQAPGMFWISIEHLFQHFESVYANWNPALFQQRQDVHFAWDLEYTKQIPGCLADNPQISLKTDGDYVIWLLLSRHFKDNDSGGNEAKRGAQNSTVDTQASVNGKNVSPAPSKEADENPTPPSDPQVLSDLARGWITLYIYDEKGKIVYAKDTEKIEEGEVVSSAQMLLKWSNPKKSTYTVVVDQEQLPPSNYTFSLSTFSLKPLTLEPAAKKHEYTTRVESGWTKYTAAGNLHSPDFSKNPQFSLKVTRRTSLSLMLLVANDSAVCNVILLYAQGKRAYTVKSRDILANSGLYKKHFALAEAKDIEAGMYTIACSTFEARQQAEFELRVDSDVPCALKAIPQEGAGLMVTPLAHACLRPSTNRVAAPLRPHKLVRVTITAKFQQSRGASTAASILSRTPRSPIRVTIEVGRGPERRVLIASSHGEFSDDAAGVRTEEVDLSPGVLNEGDIWLVVERLSGPATGCDEIYKVEMLCDSMNAVGVGVWREWYQ